MNETVVNALLSVLGSLHESSNIYFTSELIALKHEEEIEISLHSWFGDGVNYRTNTPYTFADWHVKVKQINEDLNVFMAPILMNWCFQMSFKPSVREDHHMAKTAAVDILLKHLLNTVGSCSIYEIFVDPPVWYEASWQDIVFKTSESTWLLHLGVTD